MRNDVRLNDNRLTNPKWLIGNRSSWSAFASNNGWQVASTVAVQQIVYDCKAGVFDHTRRLYHFDRKGPGPQHRTDGVKGCVGCIMQIPIQRIRRLADGETTQYLAGMLPERCADLRADGVSAREPAPRRKLFGHGNSGRIHRCRTDKVDRMPASQRDISLLDTGTQFNLAHARVN